MKAYKGFNKDMTCRGFQYEIGKEYETDAADLCRIGFHACENPLDCFSHYAPGNSRYCEVEIEDNGKGIAQKDLQKIFERFYRTDASRNSAQGGSGIGLSIVKKIIEDHGGYVWATAKEGEGTCMHFVLRKYIELQPGGTK